jgi:hypothetical protein
MTSTTTSPASSLVYQTTLRKSLAVLALLLLSCLVLVSASTNTTTTSTQGLSNFFWEADIFHLPADGTYESGIGHVYLSVVVVVVV